MDEFLEGPHEIADLIVDLDPQFFPLFSLCLAEGPDVPKERFDVVLEGAVEAHQAAHQR